MTKEDLIKALNEHKGNDEAQVLDFMKYEWSSEIQSEIYSIRDYLLGIEIEHIEKAEKKLLKKYRKRFKSLMIWWPNVEKEFRKYIISLNK